VSVFAFPKAEMYMLMVKCVGFNDRHVNRSMH